MSAVFVAGRPAWSADEAVPVQRLIVEFKLTQKQFQQMREFAECVSDGAVLTMPDSTGRALRDRGLAEVTGKPMKQDIKAHPVCYAQLTETGKAFTRVLQLVTETVENAPMRHVVPQEVFDAVQRLRAHSAMTTLHVLTVPRDDVELVVNYLFGLMQKPIELRPAQEAEYEISRLFRTTPVRD